MYASCAATRAASVHFAHLSRRFTIRTANQTQNAANATATAAKKIIISFPQARQRRVSENNCANAATAKAMHTDHFTARDS